MAGLPGSRAMVWRRPTVVAQRRQQRVDAHDVAIAAVAQPAGVRGVADEVVVAADAVEFDVTATVVGHDGVVQRRRAAVGDAAAAL